MQREISRGRSMDKRRFELLGPIVGIQNSGNFTLHPVDTADSIRTIVTKIGYTPVNACRCGKGAYAYFLIPVEQATSETIVKAKAIKGVQDANVNRLRKSLAVKYHHETVSEEQLLSALQQAGIKAALPKPHECKEEKK